MAIETDQFEIKMFTPPDLQIALNKPELGLTDEQKIGIIRATVACAHDRLRDDFERMYAERGVGK